jgi:hypothetical protein
MRTLCLAILLCLLSAPLVALDQTGGRTGVTSTSPRVLSDAAQYDIYSEVLSNFFSGGAGEKGSDQIFVSDHTPVQSGRAKSGLQKSINDRWLIGRFSESLEQETVDDYEKNRAGVVHFGARFSPALHVVLLSDDELTRIVRQSSGGLPESYRGGIVTLSRIGFNSDQTQALVSMDYFCGPFCSAQEMFLLLRSGSAWHVLRKIPISEG